MKLQYLDVLSPRILRAHSEPRAKGRADAAPYADRSCLQFSANTVVDFVVKSRLPAIYESEEFVEAGGPMTYGVS